MSARILIVEDEEPLTMLLRYNLAAEGYEVEAPGFWPLIALGAIGRGGDRQKT